MSQENTTQQIAVDFVKRAVSAINNQLKIEVERHGFTQQDLIDGKAKLIRITKQSETDPRFIAEAYSLQIPTSKKPIEHLIMCVKWSPSGFQIERNADSVANAIKVNPTFLVKKNAPKLDLGVVTQREIEIEARANEYMLKDMQKNLN